MVTICYYGYLEDDRTSEFQKSSEKPEILAFLCLKFSNWSIFDETLRPSMSDSWLPAVACRWDPWAAMGSIAAPSPPPS